MRRRPLRMVFTALCAVSLGLALVVLRLWPRSYQTADFWYWGGPARLCGAGDVAGCVLLWTQTPLIAPAPRELPAHASSQAMGEARDYRLNDMVLRHDWQFAGFCYWDGRNTDSCEQALALPCGFVLLLTLLAPARWVVLWRGRWRRERLGDRRRRLNQCVACGYDLRASLGLCPECGAPAPKAMA